MMVNKSEIVIEVEPAAAERYNSANQNEKEFLQSVVNTLLINKSEMTKDKFFNLLDEISINAETAGMTPEILEDILKK
jgi:hypothetical protein